MVLAIVVVVAAVVVAAAAMDACSRTRCLNI